MSNTLVALQWNIWFKENVERVVDVLKAHPADVICLQELTRGYIEQTHENTWEYIAHSLGYHYHVQEIPIITADAQWSQANAIFSKYPIEAKKRAWIHEPANPEAADDQYRGYLEITVDVNGILCTIGTTHMSFDQGLDEDAELSKLLALTANKPRNYVLTGDLNALPGSKRIAKLSQQLSHAGPDLTQNTWTTKPYVYSGKTYDSLDWRYDYIFTTPDMSTKDARLIQTDVSDHLPVIATLMLSDQ